MVFTGIVPLAATIFAWFWLGRFQLSREATESDDKAAQDGRRIDTRVRTNLKARRKNQNVVDPLTGAIFDTEEGSAELTLAPRGGRTRGRPGGKTDLRRSLVDQLDQVDDPKEVERITTENYLLYFSHGDLELISQKGTKIFLLIFMSQLLLWFGYACLLVLTSYRLLVHHVRKRRTFLQLGQ
jgi:hypothetical protein